MVLSFGFLPKTVLILHTDVLVIAEQCLHSAKAFSAAHAAPAARGLGVHEKLGGDTAGTADPN